MSLSFYVGVKNYVSIDGEVSRDFYPYFYVAVPDKKNVSDLLSKCRDLVVKYRKVHNVSVLVWNAEKLRYVPLERCDVYEIHVDVPSSVRHVRSLATKLGMHIAQSAIPYSVRVSIDTSNISFLDVDLRKSIEEKYRSARNLRILSLDVEYSFNSGRYLIGVYDGSEYRYFNDVGSFLDWLYEHVDDFDYVVGYNIYGFDMKILRMLEKEMYKEGRAPVSARCTFAFIYDRDMTLPVLDLYSFVKSGFRSSIGIKSTDVYALDDVCEDLGIATREELQVERSGWKALVKWVEHELVKYLETDVKLTHRLAMRLVPILEVLHSWTGISPPAVNYVAHRGASPGKLDEVITLVELYRRARTLIADRELIPDLDYSAEHVRGHLAFRDVGGRKYYFAGLKTITPARDAVYSNVLELDFSALYPTIMHSFNISLLAGASERGIIGIYLKRGYVTVEECSDISMDIIHKIFHARKITKWAKKELGWEDPDKAIKILANAIYGVVSRRGGMGLINELTSAVVFQLATSIFHAVADLVPDRVVYGDTDSLFILLRDGEDPDEIAEEINSLVQDIFGRDFEMKMEEVWSYLILYGGEVKNYIKVKVCEDEWKVVTKGGALRKDLPLFAEENIDKIVRDAVHGRNIVNILQDLVMSVEEPYRLMIRKSRALREFAEHRKKRRSSSTGQQLVKRLSDTVSSMGIIALLGVEISEGNSEIDGVDVKHVGNEKIGIDFRPRECGYKIVGGMLLPLGERKYIATIDGESYYVVSIDAYTYLRDGYSIALTVRKIPDGEVKPLVRRIAYMYCMKHPLFIHLARTVACIKKNIRNRG